MGSKHRNWIFTLNFEGERPELALPDGAKYLVYQHERGQEGHDHLQGYLELSDPHPLGWLKRNVHHGAHWEFRRGTAVQARTYAMKADTRIEGPWEFGTWNEPRPGRRTDIERIHEEIVNGNSSADILRTYPAALRLVNNIQTTIAELAPYRRQYDPEVEILVYWGTAGSGKTRRAYEELGDIEGIYLKDPTTKWWCGYVGQANVLVDDFGGEAMDKKWDLALFKQWTDKYAIQMEIKGGKARANWKKMIITSNYDPEFWYSRGGDCPVWQAVKRRLTKIVYMGTDIFNQIKYPDV